MIKNKFDKRLQSIPNDILILISSIDELKGKWSAGLNIHPKVLRNLKQSVLITSTGASTRIEGAKLSDHEIEKLMKGISTQSFKDRDEQETRGYYELLENIFDSWESTKFNENTIKHFHKELLKYVEKDSHHRGEYKKIENKVQMIDKRGNVVGMIFDTSPVYLAPHEMRELVEWSTTALAKKTHHPLLVIANFVVEFLKIHPFTDGNGRLSRLLTNLLMLQAGYLFVPYVSHEQLIEGNKEGYYLSLRKTQQTFKTKNENFHPWLVFILSIIHEQSVKAIALINNEFIEDVLSSKQLKVWEYLEKHKMATPKQLSEETNTPRPTINQIANKLIGLKKIQKIGLGRGTKYRIL